MEVTRFDLEQQIMKCWNTSDDIELIHKMVRDKDLKGEDLSNALLGLSSLHTMRSQELFEIFENMTTKGFIR